MDGWWFGDCLVRVLYWNVCYFFRISYGVVGSVRMNRFEDGRVGLWLFSLLLDLYIVCWRG